MASIEQRGKAWRVAWRYGGKANGARQSSTWHDEGLALEAKRIAEQFRHEITDERVASIIVGAAMKDQPAERPPTVEEWAETWLETRTRISPATKMHYRRRLKSVIIPAFNGKRLDDVDGLAVHAVLRKLTDSGLSDETVATYHMVMLSLFGYAVREKLINDNPVERVGWRRAGIADDDAGDDGDGHAYLTPAEYQLIRTAAQPRWRPVIDLLVGTGMRWGEASACRCGAITQGRDGWQVRVHRAWKRADADNLADGAASWYLGSTKGKTRRTVSIGDHLAQQIQPLLMCDGTRRDPDALLTTATQGGRLWLGTFHDHVWGPTLDAAMRCPDHMPAVTANGEPARGSRGAWRKGAVSTCDCPTRLHRRPRVHDLRHTHVSWLIAAGQPILAISRRLGHTSTAVTEQVYAGLLPQVHGGMADAVDAMLSDVDAATAAVVSGG